MLPNKDLRHRARKGGLATTFLVAVVTAGLAAAPPLVAAQSEDGSPEVNSPFSADDGARDCIRSDNSFAGAACDIRSFRVTNSASTVTIVVTWAAAPRINNTDGPLWEIDDPATARVPDFTVLLLPLQGHIESVTSRVSPSGLVCSSVRGTPQMPRATFSGPTITQQIPKRCLPGVVGLRLHTSTMRSDSHGVGIDLAPNPRGRPRVTAYTPVISPS